MLPVALALTFVGATQPRPAGAALRDQPGALPYQLGFDLRRFSWSATLAVSPDGRAVAYEVIHAPADSNLSDRFLPNGTPASAVGSRIAMSDGAGSPTREICPGGSCWRPAWSPDGTRLAFYSDQGGPPQLWVYEARAGTSRRLSTEPIKAKLWTGDEPRWSPDGTTLYVPRAPAGPYRSPVVTAANAARQVDPAGVTLWTSGTEAPPETAGAQSMTALMAHSLRENLADLIAVDARSGQVRTLVAATDSIQPSVLRLSASGRWLSHLSTFQWRAVTSQAATFDLAVTPTAGGPTTVVARGLPTLDDYHGLNYSWHPAEDALVYLKDGSLWLVTLTASGPAPPRRLGESLGRLAPTVGWFTRDGRAIVVGIDPVDDKGYGDPRPRGFAVVPLDGGAPRPFSLDDTRWVYEGIIRADERTVWQPDGRSLTLLLEERASGEKAMVRFDPETGADTVLWRGTARFRQVTGGGRHDQLYAVYEDYRTPADVYRFDPGFGSKARVSRIEPRLDPVAVGSAEVFETAVPRWDGTLGKVRTAVLLPPGAKKGDRLPGIVLIYPGADRSREAESFGGGSTITVPTLLFTSRGYAVVLASLMLGPNGEAGNPTREMVDGLLPQIYRAAELGYVDIERLGIAGQSFGGYGTAAIVSRTSLFRAAVAISGIYDLPGTYGHFGSDGNPFWIGWNEGGQARMGTHPWANLSRYLDNSPYYQADKIRTPMLLVHGDEDMAYHDAQKLFTALRRLDRPAILAAYAGQGHVISEWKRRSAVDAAERIVGFFGKHLIARGVRSP